jgi:hypothetical protein
MSAVEFRAVPTRLLERAYSWRGEYAWRREDALEVCGLLRSDDVAVLGGEVWTPKHGAAPIVPFPGIYAWSCEQMGRSESWADYVRRSADLALFHIERFAWESPTDDREPWFCLTADAEG